MPLYQTTQLLAKYGDALIDNSISDNDLEGLLDIVNSPFKSSSGYPTPGIVNDTNFSENDGIRDFVLTLAEKMNPDNFHELTQRIIEIAPDRGENTFMRNSSLEKVMLGYEMIHYPEKAESHFDLQRIKKAFSRTNDIKNLKNIILGPVKDFFKKPTIVETSKEYALMQTIKSEIEDYTWKVSIGGEEVAFPGKEPIKIPKHAADLYKLCSNVKIEDMDSQVEQAKKLVDSATGELPKSFLSKISDFFKSFFREQSTTDFYQERFKFFKQEFVSIKDGQDSGNTLDDKNGFEALRPVCGSSS